MALLKSGEELMQQGLDLCRRREFDKASQKFEDAAGKCAKQGLVHYANLSQAYASLVRLHRSYNNPTALLALAQFLRSFMGQSELRPGPRGILAPDLATQLELAARDFQLAGAAGSGQGNPALLSQQLQALANEYRQLGDQVLFLPELFENRSTPAASRVPVLMAVSFEILGNAAASADPIAAAEKFQTAQQYWAQAGEHAKIQATSALIERLSLQAQCWFCGRQGAGHGVQFVSMPVDVEVTGLKGVAGSPLPSVDRSGRSIYACKGCNSAVRVLSDTIAMQRSSEVAAQLRAEMAAMERRLNARAVGVSR